MPKCYYCNEPVQDDASAHLVSSSPFQLAHPKCAQKHSSRRPNLTRRITVTDIRPENGFVYAREASGGAIWRFDKRVPSNRLCKFVAAVQCMGTINPRLWTLVMDFEYPSSQIDMEFEYPNQEVAA